MTILPKPIQVQPIQVQPIRVQPTPTQAIMVMRPVQPLAHAGVPIAPIVQDPTKTILAMLHLVMKPTWRVWPHQNHEINNKKKTI